MCVILDVKFCVHNIVTDMLIISVNIKFRMFSLNYSRVISIKLAANV
jgi:hypothetical protein